jgi:hypothetical protein
VLSLLLLLLHAARGKVAYATEYWVEFPVQWAKSLVRYRTTKFPELVLVSDMLIDNALARHLAADTGCKDFDGWVPAYRSNAPSYTMADDGDEEGTQMQGSGQVLQADDRAAAVESVVQHMIEWQPAGWWQSQLWDEQLQQLRTSQRSVLQTQGRQRELQKQNVKQLQEQLATSIAAFLDDAVFVKYS